LKSSAFRHSNASPLRSTGGADAFRESKGFGASYLGVPASGVSQYGGLAGSPSRH